jgi:hypothetical protein
LSKKSKLIPYTNPTYGFTISYPDNWKVEHQDDNSATFLLLPHPRPLRIPPPSDRKGSFSISVEPADTPLLELVQDDTDSLENKPLVSEFKVRI